jgi:hypothetical protein
MGVSRRGAAQRFEVSESAAVKWLQRWRDWRELPIVPPRATLGEQLRYRFGQLGSHLKPIGLQQVMEPAKQGSALTLPERIIGFGAAGADYQNPEKMEQFRQEREQKLWEQKEKADNAVRRNQGLPPLPSRPMPGLPPPTPKHRRRTGYFAR